MQFNNINYDEENNIETHENTLIYNNLQELFVSVIIHFGFFDNSISNVFNFLFK